MRDHLPRGERVRAFNAIASDNLVSIQMMLDAGLTDAVRALYDYYRSSGAP